ncbi:MAG: sugar ABC transporter permease [Nocardiopsaceae bacterium]|nr:sugar ABC transporter permease [Nocardiopsaceae bacterium]
MAARSLHGADPLPIARSLRRVGPLVPAVVLLLLFMAAPIGWAVYDSFTNVALTGVGASSASFVGFANFTRMFADPTFVQSLVLTVVFTVGSGVVGQNILGFGLALGMRGRNRVFRAVLGSVVVAAWVVPEIVAAFIWYAYLNDQGTLNAALSALGLPHPSWLYVYPMLSAIFANIWRGTAFSMLVYSAALSDLPDDVLEAASVDGAGVVQRLWRVTLPLMKRSIMTNLMLVTLQTLSVFTLIFALTGGGPGTASQTLPLYMYQEAFKFYQLGYGAAMTLVLLAIGAIFSLIYVRVLRVEAA